MENVKPLITYTFKHVDSRVPLTMQYGMLRDEHGFYKGNKTDQRFRFMGKRIPMPVRSGTWFSGISVREMIDWLADNGYVLLAIFDLQSGFARVCELNIKHLSKGNEDSLADTFGERALRVSIKLLLQNNERVKAINLYRYAKGCGIDEANRAVREIIDEIS